MKVLIVGDYPPPYGGSSVQVSVQHRLLAAAPGFTCRILDIGTTRHQRRPECLPARNALEFAGRLLSHAARQYLLHLHTNGHNIKSWLITLACAAAGILNRRRTLVSIGSGLAPDFIQQSGWLQRGVIRAALRGMGAVICLNERTRATIVGLGIPSDQVVVVPVVYEAKPSGCSAIPPSIEEFLGRHAPVLAAIASSGPEYGIPLLLEAARRLRPRHPRLGALLIGPERFADEVLAGDLLSAGELPHEVVLAIMPKVAVFVRPTYFDGDSLSVREALALGTPVVASDTDFRPEGVALFRRGDAGDLTAAIARVLGGGSPGTAGSPPAEPAAFERLLTMYWRLGTAGPGRVGRG
jgi:glycosyltransferase involved in cell wall biosynthesis